LRPLFRGLDLNIGTIANAIGGFSLTRTRRQTYAGPKRNRVVEEVWRPWEWEVQE